MTAMRWSFGGVFRAILDASGLTASRSFSLPDKSGTLALVGDSSADLVARDQIELTNLRLLLASSVSSGALVSGYQWEFTSDEWGASSANETFTSSTPNYYTASAGGLISVATGTSFGNMTGYGGLAAAFDGSTNVGYSSCASKNPGTSGYVGRYFSAAQAISQVKVYASNNFGFTQEGAVSVTLEIYGKNGTPASETDGALLASETFTNANSLIQAYSISASYTHYWVRISETASNNLYIAEFEIYSAPTSEVTLLPPSSVTVSTAPSFMDAYFLWKDDSGAAVLGTDLTVELSRDGGTTWTTATLTNLASYDGTYSIVGARADVSAQPSGTSMTVRITTLNGKAQRVAAPALYSE